MRKKLEEILGLISNNPFKEACIEATRDIKINRIPYNKQTSYQDLMDIMSSYIRMIKRSFGEAA